MVQSLAGAAQRISPTLPGGIHRRGSRIGSRYRPVLRLYASRERCAGAEQNRHGGRRARILRAWVKEEYWPR